MSNKKNPPGKAESPLSQKSTTNAHCPLCGFHNQPLANNCQNCHADMHYDHTDMRSQQASKKTQKLYSAEESGYSSDEYSNANTPGSRNKLHTNNYNNSGLYTGNYSSEEASYSSDELPHVANLTSNNNLYTDHTPKEANHFGKTHPASSLASNSNPYANNHTPKTNAYTSEELPPTTNFTNNNKTYTGYAIKDETYTAKKNIPIANLTSNNQLYAGHNSSEEANYSSEEVPQTANYTSNNQIYAGNNSSEETNYSSEEITAETSPDSNNDLNLSGNPPKADQAKTKREYNNSLHLSTQPSEELTYSSDAPPTEFAVEYKNEFYSSGHPPRQPYPSNKIIHSSDEPPTKNKPESKLGSQPTAKGKPNQADSKGKKATQNKPESKLGSQPTAKGKPNQADSKGKQATQNKPESKLGSPPTAKRRPRSATSSAPGLLRCISCGTHNKLPATNCQECQADLRTGLRPYRSLRNSTLASFSRGLKRYATKFYKSEQSPEEVRRAASTITNKTRLGGTIATKFGAKTKPSLLIISAPGMIRCPACGEHNKLPTTTCHKCQTDLRTGMQPQQILKASKLSTFSKNFKKYKNKFHNDEQALAKSSKSQNMGDASKNVEKPGLTATASPDLLRCPSCGFHNKLPATNCRECQVDLRTGWIQRPQKKLKLATFYKTLNTYKNDLYGGSQSPDEVVSPPGAGLGNQAIDQPKVEEATTNTPATLDMVRCPACGFHNKLPATDCRKCHVNLRTGMLPKPDPESTTASTSLIGVLGQLFNKDQEEEPTRTKAPPKTASPPTTSAPLKKKLASKPEPVLNCPICGFHNKNTVTVCQRCQANIHTGVSHMEHLKQLEALKHKTPDKGAPPPKKPTNNNTVRCPFCGFHNQLPATICQKCEANLHTGIRPKEESILTSYLASLFKSNK